MKFCLEVLERSFITSRKIREYVQNTLTYQAWTCCLRYNINLLVQYYRQLQVVSNSKSPSVLEFLKDCFSLLPAQFPTIHFTTFSCGLYLSQSEGRSRSLQQPLKKKRFEEVKEPTHQQPFSKSIIMCRAVASSWYLVSPIIKVVCTASVFPCPLDAPVPPVHYGHKILQEPKRKLRCTTNTKSSDTFGPQSYVLHQNYVFRRIIIARSYSITAAFARGNIREFMVRNETGAGGEPFWYKHYNVQCGLYSGLQCSCLYKLQAYRTRTQG